MPDENSQRTDATGPTPRVVEVATSSATRRDVLRTAGTAVAGGSLLAATAERGAAAPHDGGELDVRTTDVEVLDDGKRHDEGEDSEHGEVRTTGRVSGMSNYDCERCEVGAQVRPLGGDRWYGGLQTVEHTHRDSFRAAVTLAGLHPGKYECRLCACPITHTNLFVANVLILVVRSEGKKKKKKHGKKENKHHEKKEKHRKKLKKAYRKTCPCGLHHPDHYHLMICGGDAHAPRKYAFQASSYDIQQVAVSNAPDVVSSRHVTIDAEAAIDGTVVTGTVAGGGHSYVCGGTLTDARVEPGASVFVNGSNVTAAIGSY